MKLWTIQTRTFIHAKGSPVLYAEWDRTPQNWRNWYRWMCRQWESRVASPMAAAPVWCWHSCNGILGADPTAGTFAMLLGDWDYYASSMIVVQLEAPDKLVLLSSYARWNEAMDDAIDRKLDDIDTGRFEDMFASPWLRHDSDDIQAVIPYIDTEWITDARLLPAGKSDDLDWDLPCSEFPKMPENSFHTALWSSSGLPIEIRSQRPAEC